MVWRFLKHYGTSKASGVLEEFAQAVVAFDPQSASRAQLSLMESELKTLGQRLAKAEAEVEREHRETAELRDSYDRHLEAAKLLEQDLANEADQNRAAEIERSLGSIVGTLERMKPEIAREEAEDREVEEWRAELRKAFDELAEKMRQAEAQLSSASRQMEMAKLKKARAEEAAGRSSLTRPLSQISVALDAMNAETARVRTESEALRMKADALGGNRLESDPRIADALNRVRGKGAADGDIRSRLAALAETG